MVILLKIKIYSDTLSSDLPDIYSVPTLYTMMLQSNLPNSKISLLVGLTAIFWQTEIFFLYFLSAAQQVNKIPHLTLVSVVIIWKHRALWTLK